MLQSINPATNEILGEVTASTIEDVASAIAAARKAQPAWRALGVDGRVKALQHLYDDFAKHQEDLAALAAREMGSPIEANRKVMTSRLAIFKWNLENAAKILAPETTFEDAKQLHQVHFEPYGVYGIITPWNVPFSNFIRTTLQPLIAGNTVVYKTSEETPLFGKALDEAFKRARIPEGVFGQVYGKGDIGEALVRGAVDHVHFTGSTAIGKKLYQIAAEKFIHITLELGGSDAGIIFEDADIDKIIEPIFKARFNNSGQICSALKRLFVHQSRYDELVAKLKAFAEQQKVGDPMQKDTIMGPLVSEKQKQLIMAQVEDAKAKGATVLLDNKNQIPAQGAYFEPVLLTGVNENMRAGTEELFGPVLPIKTFETEAEAIRMANDTIYGLSSYIYTENAERFQRVASQLEAGTVNHNTVESNATTNPFGGYKQSGLGRSGGRVGLQSCCQVKSVSMEKA
jgi:succinate-semialdehyde dehydrogenase/glutarate-semialdehyde dehydrogenase